MTANWKLKGQYFEACNCDAACPCVFLSAPTTGECTVLIGWPIDQGGLGDTDLGGLNVVRSVHVPGHMLEVPWTAALYLDDTADRAQTEALTRIFTGQLGGSPSKLASHIGTDLGVRRRPIRFTAEGKKRAVSVADVAEVELTAIAG